MQAAALDADTMDPLGLGRIETRSMQLLPADKAPKVSRLQRYGSVTAQVRTGGDPLSRISVPQQQSRSRPCCVRDGASRTQQSSCMLRIEPQRTC